VGAAGEGFLWRGLTLGGEAGYYRFPADRNAGYGVFMIGPGYHFVNRDKPAKIDPYLNLSVAGLAWAPGGFASAGGLGGASTTGSRRGSASRPACRSRFSPRRRPLWRSGLD